MNFKKTGVNCISKINEFIRKGFAKYFPTNNPKVTLLHGFFVVVVVF